MQQVKGGYVQLAVAAAIVLHEVHPDRAIAMNQTRFIGFLTASAAPAQRAWNSNRLDLKD
jgi:hypothetical protein